MKCILMHGSPKIHRVSDSVALTLVSAGKATYTNKEAWKLQVRPSKKEGK